MSSTTLFTKVPGLYKTRGGRYVWVKYVHTSTDYPVVGCKCAKVAHEQIEWTPNIMHAYTIDGRCMIGKDQDEDIVALTTERLCTWFKPMKNTPPPADTGKAVLFRLPPREDGFVEYVVGPYYRWMNAGDYPVQWAELP